MNILYYSVHQILEDDEVRLFKRLGHNVMCLGSNGKHGSVQAFRPPIELSEQEHALYDRFEMLGGVFAFGADIDKIKIPASFVDLFDLVIVMHEPDFIIRFWETIRRRPVVWRAIGQSVESVDRILRPYRDAGLLIVRYSPAELMSPDPLGQDALIRFGKSPDVYGGWAGDQQCVLTFSNLYRQRYAKDFDDYQQIVSDLPSKLGGGGNEGVKGALGSVSWSEQIELLRHSAVYLYASGIYIPYTLNFIEAWLIGTPVVVHSPPERQGYYFEIDRLIEDGVNGFVCRNVDSARDRLKELLDDYDLCRRVGQAGRESALKLFDERKIERQWAEFLSTLKSSSASTAATVKENHMKNTSKGVFDTVSLLKPYDIDRDKIRIGNERDGGYILADIPSMHDIISFGVGPDVSFEYEMAERGHRIFLHDHTVDRMPQEHRRFVFKKIGVGAKDEPDNRLTTLENCLRACGALSDRLILKMDVEGSEWDVFSSISTMTLEHFDQIVLEIHWLENLSVPDFETKVSRSLKKLNEQFTLFHVHANNCAELHIVGGLTVASVLELSYIRTSLVDRHRSRTVYPSSLNKSNHPHFTDHALLFYPFMPSSVEDHDVAEMMTRVDLQQKVSA